MKKPHLKLNRFQSTGAIIYALMVLLICLLFKYPALAQSIDSLKHIKGVLQSGQNEKTVLFTTLPSGASLYIDDKLIGQTPQEVKMDFGQHRLHIFHYGYARITDDIFINDNTNNFTFKLIPVTPKPPYNKDVYNNHLSLKTWPDHSISGAGNNSEHNIVPWVIAGVLSGMVAIGTHGSANRKYETYKQTYFNREEQKRQIQTLDGVSIASLTICAVSTYLVIHYTVKNRQAGKSKQLDISLMPTTTGAFVAVNFTIQ